MGLTRAERVAPRYKNYDQGRRHTYGRSHLYITIITQGNFRIIL
jgi:hypothetical protein